MMARKMVKKKIKSEKELQKDKKPQKEKPAEIIEIKKPANKIAAKSFLDLESIEIDGTRREEAPVLEKSNETQPTLENSVRNVKIEKKEDEEKPFKYSGQFKYDEGARKYTDEKSQDPFEMERVTAHETGQNMGFNPRMNRPISGMEKTDDRMEIKYTERKESPPFMEEERRARKYKTKPMQ